MTKKQITHLIHEQRPEPPEGYEARIERTLDGLMKGEQSVKRRYKVSTMLLAAALIVIALAGAALAASELKLFSAPHGSLVSSEGIEDRVMTGLGSAENELARVTVEEALYDGKTIAMLISVAPQNPEKDAILGYADSWVDTKDVYDMDIRETKNGGTEISLLGRRDGKRIITCGASLLVNGEAVEEMAADSSEDEAGCEQIWLRYSLDSFEDDPVVHCELRSVVGAWDDYGSRQWLSVSFDLARVRDERTFMIVPTGDGTGERFEILRGYLTFAKAMTYMTLDYAYMQAEGEAMGIDFRLYDANENRIDAHAGSFVELGGDNWRLVSELEAVEEIPELIILEAKVVGEDRTLGRVACRLVETDSIDLPNAPEPETPHMTYLMPKGSWVADRMRLLFVDIHETTGLVIVTFTCDDAETAERIRFTLLDADDRPLELKSMLDGEGNPSGRQALFDPCDGYYKVFTEVRDSTALSGLIGIEASMEGEENSPVRFEGIVTTASSTIGDLSKTVLVALPVDPNLVFTTGDDACYHTRPNCGQFGLSFMPMTATLADVIDMGKTACPRCCEGAE